MINIYSNKFNGFSSLPYDGDPWAPKNLLKPVAKEYYQFRFFPPTPGFGVGFPSDCAIY